MKGISIQTDLAMGGLFQTASNFDPFELMGYLKPSLAPVTIDPTTITTQIDYIITPADGSSNPYAFAMGNRSGTGAKCLYRINLLTNLATDYSDQIMQNNPTGAVVGAGLFWYGGRLIYRAINELRSNLFTPAAASDVSILASALTGNLQPIDFCVGPDGYLYYNAQSNYSIGRIVTVTGTTSNTASAFLLETGMIPRALTFDGRYLVIMADNNDGKLTNATSRCRVYFWDCVKSTAEVIWDVPDSYLIGGKYVDGKITFIGASGIWVCSAGSPPKLVFPLTSARLPAGPNKIGTIKNILYWGGSAIAGYVWGFGSLTGGKPILFSPFQTDLNGSLAHTAFAPAGSANFLAATNSPSLVLHNSGSTRNSATLQSAPMPLSQPYKFAYAKVTLRTPLASGQSISCGLYNANGLPILNPTSKTFTTDPNKQTLIFNPSPYSVTPLNRFEDCYLYLIAGVGAIVERVSVYGIPIDDYGQTL